MLYENLELYGFGYIFSILANIFTGHDYDLICSPNKMKVFQLYKFLGLDQLSASVIVETIISVDQKKSYIGTLYITTSERERNHI